MKKALLTLVELGEAGIERWRELASVAVEGNPFFESELVLPAATALGAVPALLIARDTAGEWLAAMPVTRRRGWHWLPLPVWASWRHAYSFFGAPLIRPGYEEAAMRLWLDDTEPRLGPLLGLDLLDAEGQVRAGLDAACASLGRRATVFEEHERAALWRREDELGLQLSAKRRRENARLGRRLGEQLGAELEVRDRGEDPAAVEDFLALEAASWKGRAGTAMAAVPAHAELLRQACGGFRRQGRLQVLCLAAGRRTAAIKVNFLAAGTVYCFKTAFDESLADFSPGVQLERGLVDHVADDALITGIDTCAEADNEMANRVWPERRRIVSLAAPRTGLVGSLSGLLVRGLAVTRTTIRRTQ